MDIKKRLQQLYEQYETDLANYAWAFEDDRWTELVFCFLNQCSQQEPEIIRLAVDALLNLSLIDVDKMKHLANTTHENRIVFAYVLRQYGFSDGDVELACPLLAQVANAIQQNYNGKIQCYLRRHGEVMRDELINDLDIDTSSLDKSRIAYAITHWLQNVLSLPISLQSDAVLEFCKKNSVNPQDLWRAADELNLNIALVDDLLEIDQTTKERNSEKQAYEEGGS